jgi:hypothetical protein
MVWTRTLMAAGCVCALATACSAEQRESSVGPASDAHDGAQAETRDKRRPKFSNTPLLDGTRCAAFVPFVPNSFEGYRAKNAAEGKDIELGEGASLALIRRGYFKTGTALDLEIVDTVQAKPLRQLFERTRELTRDSEAAVIKPTRISGYPALAQWNSTSRAARVSLLVESRYLVNLSLRPSDGIAAALALAQKLDLRGLAQLSVTDALASH